MAHRFLRTPWTVTHQAFLPMELSTQEYWNGLPFPSPGDLPDPRMEPTSPPLAGGFFTTEHQGSPKNKRFLRREKPEDRFV